MDSGIRPSGPSVGDPVTNEMPSSNLTTGSTDAGGPDNEDAASHHTPEMNLNLSGSINIFRLLVKPSLGLPHHTVSTFNELPIPLSRAFEKDGKKANIKAVVLDKDDCFALPHASDVYEPYKVGPHLV